MSFCVQIQRKWLPLLAWLTGIGDASCESMDTDAYSYPLIRCRTASLALLASVALLLQACGGGGAQSGGGPLTTQRTAQQTPPPRRPHFLQSCQDCPTATVQDSGHVIYLVTDGLCASGLEARAVALVVSDDSAPNGSQTYNLVRRLGDVNTTPEEIAGLGSRQVQLVQRGQWREVRHVGTWAERDGAGLLQLHGALYMMGGWLRGPLSNEVWRTFDLVHWEFLGNAPWMPRHGAAWLVHDNRMWVIGGDLYDDVWSSSDGVQWTQEAAAAPFGRRYTPNASSINGEIVVYAGQDWTPEEYPCEQGVDCVARGLRSVWKSRDGRQWQPATPQAPWEGRALVHGNAVYDGEIWMIGGGLKVAPLGKDYAETSAEFTDIWSSADGQTWRSRAAATGFAGRTHFSVLATKDGCYVSDGSVGTQSNVTNEFFHARNCVHYSPVPVPAELAAPTRQLIGGVQWLAGTDGRTTVWQRSCRDRGLAVLPIARNSP